MTSLIALLFFVFLYVTFSRHRSRIWLNVAFALLCVTIVLPVDIFFPVRYGPIYGDKHGGLRFVRRLEGKASVKKRLERYGEFVAGGCSPMPYEAMWILVWD